MITYPTTTLPQTCTSCKERSAVGYVRAMELRVLCPPEYLELSEEQQIAFLQRDQVALLRRLLSYDKIVDWARTTRTSVVGITQQKHAHPLKRYLEEVFPTHDGWHARWTVFDSACDALKGIARVSHTRPMPIFVNTTLVSPGVVSFTIYCPLPTWIQQLLSKIEKLPRNSKITRENLLVLLRAL